MATHGSFFRRSASILPRSSVCETSLFMWNGTLYAISFDRPPLPTQIVVHRVSDGVQVAVWPWTAAFGGVIIDGGNLYIIGSTQPSSYVAGNQVILSQLDPVTFQPGTPTTLVTAPGAYSYTIPNSGLVKATNGTYVLACDYFLTSNNSQGRIVWYTAPSLTGPYTRTGNVTQAANFSDQYMVGAPKPFYVPNGAHPNRCYFLYNSSSGGSPGFPQLPCYMALAYTDDFLSFSVAGTWVYPDSPSIDGVNSSDGSQPVDLGNGYLIFNYLAGDQSTWSAVFTGLYQGSLAQLVAEFGV